MDSRSGVQVSWASVISVAVFSLLILLMIWIATPITGQNGGEDSDGHYYAAMARAPFSNDAMVRTPPYAWRPLTPLAASLLPFELSLNFRLLALLSHWVATVLLWLLLRSAGLSSIVSSVGVLLYLGVFWTAKFAFYSPFYVDWAMMPIELAVLLSISTRRFRFLPLLLGLGVLVREQLALFGLVAWLRASSGRRWPNRLWLLAKFLGPPLLLTLALRFLLPASAPYSPLLELVRWLLLQALNPSFWPQLALAVISGLGLLPVLALALIRPIWKWSRGQLYLLVTLGLQVLVLFGGVDKSRLFLFGLPVMVLLVCVGIDWVLTNSRGRGRIWLVLTVLLHFYLGHQFEQIAGFEGYLARMVPEHALGSISSLANLDAVAILIWIGMSAILVFPSRWSLYRAFEALKG